LILNRVRRVAQGGNFGAGVVDEWQHGVFFEYVSTLLFSPVLSNKSADILNIFEKIVLILSQIVLKSVGTPSKYGSINAGAGYECGMTRHGKYSRDDRPDGNEFLISVSSGPTIINCGTSTEPLYTGIFSSCE